LNITEAITLRRQIQEQPDFPIIQLLSTFKEGYLLWIKADLLNEDHYKYLEQVALENKLSLLFEQGYWVLIEPF
jgi:hypothetical protein